MILPALLPKASPSPRLGVRNLNPKLQSLLSQERVKLWTANLADIFTGFVQTKAHYIWEKRECGHIQGLPKFFEYPLLSQERVKLQTSNFYKYIHRVRPNKSPLKISAKVTEGILRDSRIFKAAMYRAHRTVIFAVAQLSCVFYLHFVGCYLML